MNIENKEKIKKAIMLSLGLNKQRNQARPDE
jgi:hypothetical protein